LNENEIVVIDYSILEDSYIFDEVDMLIKVNNVNNSILDSDIKLMMKT
jgi:hypothetical protein